MINNRLSTYLASLFWRYKIYLCSLAMLAIIAGVFNIAINYKIKEIIDSISSKNGSVVWLLAIFVFYKFMHHGMFFISRLLDIKYKPVILVEVMSSMYSKTLAHSLHWFDSHLSGEISSKITDFQGAFIHLITFCFKALNNSAVIVISILFLLQVNFLSTAVLFLFVLIYIPIIYFLLKKQLKLQEQYTAARQETVGIVNDSITNIFGIKIIGNEQTEFKLKLTPSLLRWSNWDRKTRVFDAWWVDNADTIMVTIMSAVQIYLLAYLYRTDQITAGGFAFIAMTTLNIHGELDKFLDSLLFNIIPGVATLKSSFGFVSNANDTADKLGAKIISNVQGNVEFNNINFAYADSKKNVLDNFNLIIPAGQKVGIVGTSGAGKTTIIKCLLRYFDVKSGEIKIDGHDVSSITQESLRANISVIPQDITMFHRTILENLQLAKHDATFAEVVEACKKAKIHDDILAMKNGYNSIVGERGIKLSGGQRQRIAIARAILKDAPILILDEATSGLDSHTENHIQESLNLLIADRSTTIIAIAHRLSTLKHMDRIIVLDKGKIIEDGTHEELIKTGGYYQSMWNMQAGGFLPESIDES